MPRTPATLGFCARGIGELSKEPLRFKPREKENKSKVSLSGRVRGHCSVLNQDWGVAWRVNFSLMDLLAHIPKSDMCH